jgi:hypothetical protein
MEASPSKTVAGMKASRSKAATLLACGALAALLLLTTGACVGTTGGDVIDFPVAAAGPADAAAGKPFALDNDRGWHVVLTKATLHVGAVYLSQAQPISGVQNSSCVLPGTYVAQVTRGADVDLLSPAPQRFPTPGHGTTLESLVGQVWLTGGPVDSASDATPILLVEGTAERAGDVRPFTGQLTISTNRQQAGGASAGASTMCKQRIVTPIPTPGLVLQHQGGLLLRIDPRVLFVNVDFGALAKVPGGYAFSDDPSEIDPASPSFYGQPSVNLYQNLHAAGGLYTFAWDARL